MATRFKWIYILLIIILSFFIKIHTADTTETRSSDDSNSAQDSTEGQVEIQQSSEILLNNDVLNDAPDSEEDLPTFSSDVTEQTSLKVEDNAEDTSSQIGKEPIEDGVESSSTSNETVKQDALTNSTTNTTFSGEKSPNGTVSCVPRERSENEIPMVEIVNGTTLLKELTPASNESEGQCTVVLFYFPWCVFSARAAPHFNALARVFPQISCFAIDADSRNNLNMRYGLVAVPTVLLFHNGRVIAKFNDSIPTLEKFVSFITKYTGLVPASPENVTIISADMMGPVPTSPVPKTDYILILSWVFCLMCFSIAFLRSSLCHHIVECISNTWKEAEAQHEHEE